MRCVAVLVATALLVAACSPDPEVTGSTNKCATCDQPGPHRPGFSFPLDAASFAQAGFCHEVWLSTIRPNWRPSTPPRFGRLGALYRCGQRRASGH